MLLIWTMKYINLLTSRYKMKEPKCLIGDEVIIDGKVGILVGVNYIGEIVFYRVLFEDNEIKMYEEEIVCQNLI